MLHYLRLIWHIITNRGGSPMSILNWVLDLAGENPEQALKMVTEAYEYMWREGWQGRLTVEEHRDWQKALSLLRRSVELDRAIKAIKKEEAS